MKTTVNYKLIRKCLILAVMILGLVFVVSSTKYSQPVSAAPCCEDCPGDGHPEYVDDYCGIEICYFYQSYGYSSYDGCVASCESEANNCYAHCVFCNGGGGPGGECYSNDDCPPSQFCGAGNTCVNY